MPRARQGLGPVQRQLIAATALRGELSLVEATRVLRRQAWECERAMRTLHGPFAAVGNDGVMVLHEVGRVVGFTVLELDGETARLVTPPPPPAR